MASGGLSGELRAVAPLRVVFAELHTVTIRNTVSFHSAREQFDEHETRATPGAVNAAMDVLLDQLAWWGWGAAGSQGGPTLRHLSCGRMWT